MIEKVDFLQNRSFGGVRETCDMVVSLPMLGKVNSLNASVSAGILMYEIVKYKALLWR